MYASIEVQDMNVASIYENVSFIFIFMFIYYI